MSADGLVIEKQLQDFIAAAAKEQGLEAATILSGFAAILRDMAPENRRLLDKRDLLQQQIDHWLTSNKPFDARAYEQFLTGIGYIVPEGGAFQVTTSNVDREFTTPGPQLVCPVFIGSDPAINARYPLNAVNARWGSLYDALYGKSGDQNVIDEKDGKEFTKGYNPKRGEAVIAYVAAFLDRTVPLAGASYNDVTAFTVESGKLAAKLASGKTVTLTSPQAFIGYVGNAAQPTAILLSHNELHIEILVDPNNQIGKQSKAGVKDVVLEAALTAIIDLEDAASAVDGTDKLNAYRNLFGLTRGDLKARMVKEEVRTLAKDRIFTGANGKEIRLPGRCTMLFRRTGMHMYTDCVTLDGKPVPEGYVDTLMIALAGMLDLKKRDGELRNSRTGSIYIVMPKMHGPEEAAHNVALFGRIEKLLGLPERTLKIGIMDEEQRTSVNLRECVCAAHERIVFINTGFLDRTGDLIHTVMQAGPLDTKAGMKDAPWLDAYERSNMQVGLATGLYKAGQIGKGMWTQNRNPAGLVATKAAQLKAGAITAWVPDPKNAVLHAMHYHEVNVKEVQQKLLAGGNAPVAKSDILKAPLLPKSIAAQEKEELLYGYMQSVLGYVTPWVNDGVGCSSVPDHTGTYLMEDRATLRIGSQLLANWLKHGVMNDEELAKASRRAAATVDEQNAKTPGYVKLTGNFDGPAFQAALQLVYEGAIEPNGYVEPVLHAARKDAKMNGAHRGGEQVRLLQTFSERKTKKA